MRSWILLLICGLWGAFCQADEPLQGGIIRDLNSLQAQLADASPGELASVVEHATSQASRLSSGNRSDQWASALYSQLAASALGRQENYVAAADQLAQARQRSSVPASQRAQWLREEAGLRRAADQYERAITLYEQALQEREDSALRWQLVRLLAEQTRWEQAAEQMDPLLASDATLDDAQRGLVMAVMRHAKRSDMALDWLLDGLSVESDADEWCQAAGLAQQAGQPGVAAALWSTAWRLGKLTQRDDLLTLVRLHLSGGTPARGAEALASALKAGVVERDEQTLRLLANAWQQARDVEQALSAWQALANYTNPAAARIIKSGATTIPTR